jgi:hypothetical protein
MTNKITTSVSSSNAYTIKDTSGQEVKNPSGVDLEAGTVADTHLLNTTVKTISWKDVTVTVKDRETKEPRNIVDKVEGIVEAGSSTPPLIRNRSRMLKST